MAPEIDIYGLSRGSVTAPAGCGKTQLIASSLLQYSGIKPVLVLTHTNAGVSALRVRLQRGGVSSNKYRLGTIDGFAMRLAVTFPGLSRMQAVTLQLNNPSIDYPTIRLAVARLLHEGHLGEALAATYSRIIVDEYQDCSLTQHAIVNSLAEILPTCVLGDPMQAIFDFGSNQLVNWSEHVLGGFPSIGELHTPWRWRNAGAEGLGEWLLFCRRQLAGGNGVDLGTIPNEVQWIRLTTSDADRQRLIAASTSPVTRDGSILIIGDSINKNGRHRLTSQTPGASTVEPVDLGDLISFSRRFALSSQTIIDDLLGFAADVMTNIGAPELIRRVRSLRSGTARNPANSAEQALISLANTPSFSSALYALSQLSEQEGVRVYRPELFHSCISAMQIASGGSTSLLDAAIIERERNRYSARHLRRRVVGSTLLLKGLEADAAVVLHPELMNARHLYVALTRGARRIVICSESQVLLPRR